MKKIDRNAKIDAIRSCVIDCFINEMYYRDTQPTDAFRKSLDGYPPTITALTICKSVVCAIITAENLAERTLLY